MIPAISRKAMIEIDRIMTEDLHVDIELMMEQAGYNFAQVAAKYRQDKSYDKIIIVSGNGNNGGGGLVAARRLQNWGIPVTVWLPKSKPLRDVPQRQRGRAEASGVQITFDQPPKGDHLVLDSFIGYNFQEPVRDGTRGVFDYMRDNPCISLDIPSGVDSSEGHNPGQIHPMATITLGWPKLGMLKLKKRELGQTFLVDIGIPKSIFSDYRLVDGVSISDLDNIYHRFRSSSCLLVQIHHDGWKLDN